MPKITIDSKFVREHDFLRLRALKAKERLGRVGIYNLKPFYVSRYGRPEGNEFTNTFSARDVKLHVLEKIELLTDDFENGILYRDAGASKQKAS